MTQTATVYGSALYDLALEQQQTEAYLSETLLLRKLLAENPRLLQLLCARSVSLEERKQVLDTCFGGFMPELRIFMKLLCDKNTAAQLPDCLRQFELRYNADHGIMEVTATSAVALSDSQQAALQQKLEAKTGKTVRLHCVVDAAVLGGMRLSMDGQELDGTLRRRLDTLSDELKQLTL